MKLRFFAAAILLLTSSFVLAQNANNTPVQGGGSMSGYNSGSAPTGQGNAAAQEARTKTSNAKTADAVAVRGQGTRQAAGGANLLPPGERTKQYTDALRQILKLNEEQYGKMTTVNAEFIKQIDNLTQTAKDNVAFQQGIMEADKTRVDKYRSILNLKQFKLYTDNPQLSGLTGNNEPVRTDNGKPDASVQKPAEASATPAIVAPKATSGTKN